MNDEGAVIRRGSFRVHEWNPFLKREGIRHRGAHHTRHTYATLMLGSGVPLHVVAKILGHARPGIAADLYAHAIPEQVDATREATSRIFG